MTDAARGDPARLHVRLPKCTASERRAMLQYVRATCRNCSGVYRILGARGEVLYVGKSRRLRTRLLSYFRARGRRNKSARILRHAFRIEWEYTPNEFSALLTELRLIKQYRPEFNSTYVTDEWPRAYIAIIGGHVPALRVVPRSDDPAAVAMYGPFRRVGLVRSAVRVLAEITGVRDCAIDEVDGGRSQPLWFESETVLPVTRKRRTRAPGCLRVELGSCAGPCIGGGQFAAYDAGVAQVRAFLDGRSRAPLHRIEQSMREASESLAFERAARLRDRAVPLTWLHKRLRAFRADVDRLSFVYHADANDSAMTDGDTPRRMSYVIRRGTVRAQVPRPVTTSERDELVQVARRIFSGPDPKGRDIPLHDLDEFHLVSSWFRRNPEEMDRIEPVAAFVS